MMCSLVLMTRLKDRSVDCGLFFFLFFFFFLGGGGGGSSFLKLLKT